MMSLICATLSASIRSATTGLAPALVAAPHEVLPWQVGVSQGLLLAAAGLCLLPLWRRALMWSAPGRSVFFVSWGFSQVLVGVLAATAASLIVSALVRPAAAGQWAFLAALTALAGTAFWASRRTQREPLRALGLWLDRPPRQVLCALAALACAVPVLLGLAAAWPLLAERAALALGAGATTAGFEVTARLQELSPLWAWGIALLISPWLQELCLRGFLQPLLIQNFSERGGLLLSALIFASIHGASGFPVLLVLGLVLAEVKLRTHSTWAAWLTHAAYMLLCLLQQRADLGWPLLPPTF
jgi:membrane protease YdiL (CAAX protease family)